MKDVRLSLRDTVLLWTGATLLYLVAGSAISEMAMFGTLTLGDLVLAVLILGWLVIAARWFMAGERE